MKKTVIILSFCICNYTYAQNGNGNNGAGSNNGNPPTTATSANAVELAQKIAKKMKDTLGLTAAQKNQIYDVNMDLHNQKQAARTTHAGNPTAMSTAIQNIEKTRDDLYKPILTDAEFLAYKQKKRVLISNN
jgi:hypothetical protein